MLGSAAIAAMMEVRITAELSAAAGSAGGAGAGTAAGASGALPGFLHTAFSRAMGQSEYLPAAVIALGMVAALFLVSARRDAARKAAAAQG